MLCWVCTMHLLATHFWWCRLQMVWLSLCKLLEPVGNSSQSLPAWIALESGGCAHTVDNMWQLCLRKGLQVLSIHVRRQLKPLYVQCTYCGIDEHKWYFEGLKAFKWRNWHLLHGSMLVVYHEPFCGVFFFHSLLHSGSSQFSFLTKFLMNNAGKAM